MVCSYHTLITLSHRLVTNSPDGSQLEAYVGYSSETNLPNKRALVPILGSIMPILGKFLVWTSMSLSVCTATLIVLVCTLRYLLAPRFTIFSGSGRAVWSGGQEVLAVAFDVPIPGYATKNTLVYLKICPLLSSAKTNYLIVIIFVSGPPAPSVVSIFSLSMLETTNAPSRPATLLPTSPACSIPTTTTWVSQTLMFFPISTDLLVGL